jgi:pimeloyl-ACP methyl ester carboxylesterase
VKTVRTGVLIIAVFYLLVWTLPARAGAGGAKGPSLEGAWLGTPKMSSLKAGRIGFLIQGKPDGSFSGTFVSLDEGATAIPASRVRHENGRVTIEVGAIGGRYEGTLNLDSSQIDGRWIQRGASLELVLQRVQPQEPQRPYPYFEEEVTYLNAPDVVTLAATLTLPPMGGPFPAVILISGSGQEDRDETIYGHRPFLVLADYLTRRGIGVLRVDDRGVGGSTGEILQATSEDFARDVLAGVMYLKTRKEIDPNRIGLIGHSDGGVIGPLTAVDSNDVAFLVLMAGCGVPGDLILEGQTASLLRLQGASQAMIDAAVQDLRRKMEVVKSEPDPNRAQEKLRALGCTEAQVQAWTCKWFYFFVIHNPQETLRKVRCPVLAINGDLDVQVVAKVNLPAIEQALREGGNPDFTVQELPRLNHLFQTAQTGNINEYAFLEETMSPMALEPVAAWIEARTKQRGHNMEEHR